jgi:hypothetical protein
MLNMIFSRWRPAERARTATFGIARGASGGSMSRGGFGSWDALPRRFKMKQASSIHLPWSLLCQCFLAYDVPRSSE